MGVNHMKDLRTDNREKEGSTMCEQDKRTRPALSDEQCEKAWDKIMAIAREHCLVVSAYGGVAQLAIPDEQRKSGLREQVLRAHCRKETQNG